MTQPAALQWLSAPPAVPSQEMRQLAEQRQTQLTKPPGSLGRLEEFAIRLAAMQNTRQPNADRVHIAIFAADHGVAAEGVSAFPQSVTAEMIRNFTLGGAAINVLARTLNASLEIINLGTVHDTQALAQVRHCHLGPGTANFVHQPAMTWEQLSQAFQAGFETTERAQQTGQQLFIGGEMGIGNTTSATALACLLLNERPVRLTGRGTGLDEQGIAHKITIITRALSLHRPQTDSPLDALRRVGGFEIAALTGAYIHGAQLGLPLLIDGFISTVAALAAEHVVPGCKDWFIFSHQSSELGHALVLKALNADPFIDLQMRLGEGSGAAVTLNLLRMACKLHNEMATSPKLRFHNKVSFRSILTTSIDLLRHGVTENSQRYCGSTNYPLTALGWTQMWHAVNSQSTQWQHIVTSPLARCADFAHAMEQHYSIPVTQDDRIREIHFGDWEDRSSAELMHTDAGALSRFWQNPFDYPPPNGEHLLDFQARVLSAWDDIQQKFYGKKVLLITHGGVIRMIVCHILQHPLKCILDIDVRHASIRHVRIDHAEACRITLDPNSSL